MKKAAADEVASFKAEPKLLHPPPPGGGSEKPNAKKRGRPVAAKLNAGSATAEGTAAGKAAGGTGASCSEGTAAGNAAEGTAPPCSEGTAAGKAAVGTDAGQAAGAALDSDGNAASQAVGAALGSDGKAASKAAEGTDADQAAGAALCSDGTAASKAAEVTDACQAAGAALCSDSTAASKAAEVTDAGQAAGAALCSDSTAASKAAEVTDAGQAAGAALCSDGTAASKAAEVKDAGQASGNALPAQVTSADAPRGQATSEAGEAIPEAQAAEEDVNQPLLKRLRAAGAGSKSGPSLAATVASGGAPTLGHGKVDHKKLEELAQQARSNGGPIHDRNSWRRFERTLTAAPTERQSKVARAPPEVVDMILADMGTGRLWFTRWGGNAENWGLALVHEQIIRRELTENTAGEAWLTFAQVKDLYKCEVVATAICGECLQDASLWRKHPRVPHIEDATQFWVRVNEGMNKKLQDVVSKAISFKGEVDMDQGLQLASRLKQPLAPTFGQTQLALPAPPASEGTAPAAQATGPQSSLPAADQDPKQREQMLKTAQAARAKADAAAARAQKSADAKAAKDAHKASTKGKAEAWLHGCQKKLNDIGTVSEQCDNQDVDLQVRELYKTKMDGHRDRVVELRTSIERSMAGSSDDDAAAALSRAGAVLEQFKQDRQAWGVIFRLATKK